MNSSLYIGATGMKTLSQGMQVVSNNLANVSTIGYKQQNALFSNMVSQTQGNMGEAWQTQQDSRVGIGQVGMGVQIEDIRTIFTEAAKETTNIMTDLAINGKGFFQVSDENGNLFYTRAGDFQTDNEGVWRTPSGLALNGYALNPDGTRGELGQIQVDKFSTMPPRASTSLELSFNLSTDSNKSSSTDNPYFSLLESYNATAGTPLDSSLYSSSQQMTIFDADGNRHTVTAYFDGAPSNGANKFMEFVIANDNVASYDEEGNPLPVEAGDGLLMAGVLEFDSTGKLVNISAFTPQEAGTKDLSQWTVAELTDGNPTLQINGTPLSINFGLSSVNGWANAPASAAEIGATAASLPGLGDEIIAADYPTTAYNTSAMTNTWKQDGYAGGALSTISVGTDGVITGSFSNGQTMDLFEIPVARFTSEDGLYRQGGNLFSATEASGQMELGTAGTENYGKILAYNLETSNVDTAVEFVNMIMTQRGFQSNSKVVTTADELLQKAMELKRS